ncbi:hypothetical protein MLGJGCBP_05396 [Rhodococcus sp. T7]|nr:hypothetical protein [Rhodococcus sp. T7]KAF0957831.1 hypothetical protein MLGJGCBP_09663 [Rhodococcus sp. T7]KAF0961516.1 hypothetical protein MLGJGCBP_05396 [Rhodococcus sp. T7]
MNARKRGELLDATEAELGKIVRRGIRGRGREDRPTGRPGAGKYRVGKHFHVRITDTSLTVTRDRDRIDAEDALDGICTLRTTASADELDTATVIVAYKHVSRIEGYFRSPKAIDLDLDLDLDLRPIYHRLTGQVTAHVLICMLATYLPHLAPAQGLGAVDLRTPAAPVRIPLHRRPARPPPRPRRPARSPPTVTCRSDPAKGCWPTWSP